ncbi:protein of unknown function [Burkholderia multivorans]
MQSRAPIPSCGRSSSGTCRSVPPSCSSRTSMRWGRCVCPRSRKSSGKSCRSSASFPKKGGLRSGNDPKTHTFRKSKADAARSVAIRACVGFIFLSLPAAGVAERDMPVAPGASRFSLPLAPNAVSIRIILNANDRPRTAVADRRCPSRLQ